MCLNLEGFPWEKFLCAQLHSYIFESEYNEFDQSCRSKLAIYTYPINKLSYLGQLTLDFYEKL